MKLEIVFVGLCAVLMDRELDCKNVVDDDDHEAAPLDVVMLDPGKPHEHLPMLWIRVDALEVPPASCWNDDRDTQINDAQQCEDNAGTTWVWRDLSGKELLILQKAKDKAKIKHGHREIGPDCWQGEAPDDDPAICKSRKSICEKDASWIAEYAKVNGGVSVQRDMVASPTRYPFVASIVRGLRGTLEAYPADTLYPWTQSWLWEKNHETCTGSPPQYQQTFATGMMISDVTATDEAIHLIPISGQGTTETIPLAGSTSRLEIWSLPKGMDHTKLWMPASLMIHPTGASTGIPRCYLPHFDAYSLVIDDPPKCRWVPYFEATQIPDPADPSDPSKKIWTCGGGQYGPKDGFCSPAGVP